MSALAIAFVALAFAAGAFAQAVSGFGFALVTIPLLTLAVSRGDAVVGQTLAGFTLSVLMAWHLRRDIDRATLRRLLPAAAIGMPVGLLVGRVVSERGLRAAIGVVVIGAAVVIGRGWRVRSRHVATDYVAGLVSGVLSTTTGTNGPPIVIALSSRETLASSFRATLQAFFAFGNLVAIPLFALDGRVTGRACAVGAVGLVPTFGSRLVGEVVFRRMDQTHFRNVVLGMLVFAGSVAIVNAFR